MVGENIILSPEAISRALSMIKREEYLKKHRYEIYQGKDGKWYTYLPDKDRGRRKIKRNTYDLVVDAVVEYYETNQTTVEELFTEWNDRRVDLHKIKESTGSRNRCDFERFFKELGKRRVIDLTPDEISDFLELQVSRFDLTAKAFSNLKTLTRGILKRAKKLKLISWDVEPVFADLDISDREFKKKKIEDGKEIFYGDECEDLIGYCKEHKDDLSSLGIALMYVSGIRVGEDVCLKKTDILDREVSVHRIETQYRKDGLNHFEVSDSSKTEAGVRKVIIPDAYKWILDELLKRGGDEWIFTGIHGKRMHTAQIRKRLYSVCRNLEIPVRSPHKLRKTYGTILLDNHVDSKVIEKQMGHTDVLTTELHYHRDRKRTQQKRDIINSIAEFS